MIKLILLLSFVLNASGLNPRNFSSPGVHAGAISYKSYKEWKEEQINFWNSRDQADMAQDLTVADYFAGYLTKQKDRSRAIREVSRRLSHDEVAELMTVYANSVFGTHPSQLPSQADNLGKELGK